jgi:hypothetical protein
MGWTSSTCGEKRSVYKVLVGKPDGKRPLGRHMRRKEMSGRVRSDLCIREFLRTNTD